MYFFYVKEIYKLRPNRTKKFVIENENQNMRMHVIMFKKNMISLMVVNVAFDICLKKWFL